MSYILGVAVAGAELLETVIKAVAKAGIEFVVPMALRLPWGALQDSAIDAETYKKDASKHFPDINNCFVGFSKLVSVARDEPVLRVQGKVEPTPAEKAARVRHLRKLNADGRLNEQHFLVDMECSDLHASPMVLIGKTADFAAVCALRDNGGRPAILSAGTFLTCRERGSIIVHARSQWVHTYKLAYHIFGGNYMAQQNAGDETVQRTLRRELEEETGMALNATVGLPYVLAVEETTGFVQLITPPFDVSAKQLEALTDSAEGAYREIHLSDLLACLLDSTRWVPSGLMHVLLWLMLGGPAVMGRKLAYPFPASDMEAMGGRVLDGTNSAVLRKE